ncbi:MAG: hypothetical protein V3U84_12495 [Thiotrichaceae bacterium]
MLQKNNAVISGKEDFIAQVTNDPSLLEFPIAKEILGNDYENICQELSRDDNPETRLEYGQKLIRLGYTQEQISGMPLHKAKKLVERAQQVKTLIGMGFKPDEIQNMNEKHIKELIALL